MPTLGMNDVKVALSNLEYGVLFATLLFGATMVQTYHVLISDSRNTRWLKPLVSTICVIETVHTALLWVYLHYLTVTEFGSPVAILVDHWSYDLSFMMFALAREPIRAFFTYRIYVLSNRRKALCIPLWVLEFVNGGLTLAIAYAAYASKTIFVFIARWSWLVSTALVLAVIIDVANTGCLCWYMYRNSDGLEGMRTVSRKVIMYTLETGLATCVVALATLLLWYLQPNTGMWAATSMIYSKLYSNALLACLGTRERLRQHIANDLSEASDRRNTLRLGADAPRTRAPKDRHDDLEGDGEGFPMSTPALSKRGSCRTDMSTVVTD